MKHVQYEYYDPEQPETSFRRIPDGPVILDFTGCKYIDEVHEILKERFGLPDYYGKNWSAFWDCLDGFADEPLDVRIKGLSLLPEDLAEAVERMLAVLEAVHKTTPNFTIHIEP